MAEAAPKALRDGRYVLLAPLGQGTQGTTWDAVDKREGRAVAVKAFDVRGARAWKDVELAEREARVLSELTHPSLPRYIEHFEEEGALYLVMEKVHGTPLSVVQRKEPRMSEKDLTRFLTDADHALTYLHGRTPPVIHRDLKPSNVIRRTDGSYSFVDFGAVRDRLRPEGGSTVVGTFGYMAPEQFQGRAGPASDVYAIGATALALLTGQEPEKLPHRGLSIDVEAALGGTSPRWVRDVLARMLEPDPDKRATSIGPLLDRASHGGTGEKAERRNSRREEAPWDVLRDAMEAAAQGSRQARRAARRAGKRQWKEARRRARHHHHELPAGIRLLFGLGLSIAQLAVALALDMVVPLVLTLLSVVFGSGLRRAAGAVRAAGGRAHDAIGHARTELGHAPISVIDVPLRAPSPATSGEREDARVRVAVRSELPHPESDEGSLEDDDETSEEKSFRRGRSRR